jgi:CubicO group peptidase (beta-lactamase class C family)
MPLISLPLNLPLNHAQRAELSRHLWHGGTRELWNGKDSAEAVLAVATLGEHPPSKDEPLWQSSGFIQAAEHRLKLRLALEGRKRTPLAPPERLATPAPELRAGSEIEAGMRPGTLQKLRALAREWAKEDPNPFVVLVARRGVVFMHEGFNGFRKDSGFRPASIGKTIAALTFARAVDQGLLTFDQPVGSVLADWKHDHTARVTFRHCFLHLTGLSDHASHGGLYNAYLDNALLVEDAAFARPGTRFLYNGDDINLAGKALEMLTGQSIWRLLYEQMQKPFGEPVTQFDLGFGDSFTAMYLAKVGQMILQDGRYGANRFYRPGFLAELRPQRVADFAPDFKDPKLEWGIGFTWMPDPPGPREKGVLGLNVIGHGASSGVTYRIDKDHELVVVVGRNAFKDSHTNEVWATKLAQVLAGGI